MGKKDEDKSFGEALSENLRGFGHFIYNPQDGTVLGRNASGWGK